MRWFQVIGKKGRTRITTVRNAQKHQIPKCTAFRELLNFQVGARRTNGHVLSPAFFLEVRQKTSKNVSRTEDAEHFSRSPQLGCCETQLWWCQHRCGMFFFHDLSCFFSCVRCEWHLNLLMIWYDLFISVLWQWLAQGDRKSDWWSWKDWEDWEQTERPWLRSGRSDGSDRSTIMTCLCRESKNKKKKKRNKRKEWQSKEKDDASGSAGSGSEGGIVWQILSLVHLRWGGEE